VVCLTNVQGLYIYGCEIETPLDCMRCRIYGKPKPKIPIKLEHVDKSLSDVMTQRNLDAIKNNDDDYIIIYITLNVKLIRGSFIFFWTGIPCL
jgi:hypothetical protein